MSRKSQLGVPSDSGGATPSKTARSIFIALVVMLLIFSATRTIRDVSNSQHENEVAESVAFVEQELAKMNSSLPKMFDEGYRLDRISFVYPAYHHYYTLTLNAASEIDLPMFGSEQRELNKEDVCGNAELANSLNEGVQLVFHYVDMNDEPIAEFTFKNGDCS